MKLHYDSSSQINHVFSPVKKSIDSFCIVDLVSGASVFFFFSVKDFQRQFLSILADLFSNKLTLMFQSLTATTEVLHLIIFLFVCMRLCVSVYLLFGVHIRVCVPIFILSCIVDYWVY